MSLDLIPIKYSATFQPKSGLRMLHIKRGDSEVKFNLTQDSLASVYAPVEFENRLDALDLLLPEHITAAVRTLEAQVIARANARPGAVLGDDDMRAIASGAPLKKTSVVLQSRVREHASLMLTRVKVDDKTKQHILTNNRANPGSFEYEPRLRLGGAIVATVVWVDDAKKKMGVSLKLRVAVHCGVQDDLPADEKADPDAELLAMFGADADAGRKPEKRKRDNDDDGETTTKKTARRGAEHDD